MKIRSILLAAAAFACAHGAAVAADAPKPLRTLVYNVTYSAQQTQEEKISGFDSPGAPNVQHEFDVADTGQLTFDVIAATGDGGLVVDASFNGRTNDGHNKIYAPIRVAIFPDGRLSWDTSKELEPEAIRLLPFLARGLVAEREIAPGDAWDAPAPAPAKGSTSYRIIGVDGAVAKLALKGTLSVPGRDAFDETSEDNATYDTAHLMPVDADVSVTTRRQVSASTSSSTKIHLVAKLASDSFTGK